MLPAGLAEAARQGDRVEQLVERRRGQVGALAGDIAHGAIVVGRFLGDVGRVFVSDGAVQCGGDRRGVVGLAGRRR